jgi:hypothetical protein
MTKCFCCLGVGHVASWCLNKLAMVIKFEKWFPENHFLGNKHGLKKKENISTNSKGKVETPTSCNNDKMFLLFGSWSCCFAVSKQVSYGYKSS